jgi:hypothetical protein
MYKFYINDPVRFQKSIRVTLEHGHANNFENDYTTTAFWYQLEPHKAFPVFPSASERLPGWPADVAAALEREPKLGAQLAALRRNQKVSLSEADAKRLQSLTADANKAFRDLNFPEYVRIVAAEQSVVDSYRQKEEPKKE